MSDADWIFNVVSAFYEKAKDDVMIGYHFRNIQDFDSHIPRIAAFWDLQLRGKTEREIDKKFDVLNAHLPLNIKRGELGRWLVLFKKTMDEKLNQPEQAELKKKWLERLDFFEGTFLRFFRF